MSSRPPLPKLRINVRKKTLIHQATFVNSDAKYPALIGGLGSGKTDAGIARILRLKYKYPTLDVAYYMPDYNLIRDRGMSGVEAELKRLGQPFSINKTDKIIKLWNKGNIYFRSMDNPDKIVAYEVADSIIDELDTLDPKKAKHVYRKIKERNRQNKPDGKPNTIGVITTPDYGTEGYVWELYNRCINKETMDGAGNYELLNFGRVGHYHLIEARTADNPFLPGDYLEGILEMYDPILANLFTRGKMVSLSQDKVYHFYDPFDHDTNEKPRLGDTIHIGVDFNVGGCACVAHIEREIDGRIKPIAIAEFAPKDTYAIAIEVNRRFKGYRVVFYPDSSGDSESSNASKTDIQILKDEVRTPLPPKFNYPKVNGAIRDRVNSVNNQFSKDNYLVNRTLCPKVSHAYAVQGWGKDGKPEKSKEHKGGAVDDFTDAGGYYIVRRFGLIRHRVGVIEHPMR